MDSLFQQELLVSSSLLQNGSLLPLPLTPSYPCEEGSCVATVQHNQPCNTLPSHSTFQEFTDRMGTLPSFFRTADDEEDSQPMVSICTYVAGMSVEIRHICKRFQSPMVFRSGRPLRSCLTTGRTHCLRTSSPDSTCGLCPLPQSLFT